MRMFLKKILSNMFKSNQIDLKMTESQKINKELRENKESDLVRWSQNEELYSDWDERTLLLGAFINPNAMIIEFGAGNMILKTNLKNYKSYTPSDIIQRFEETLVCDLNETINLNLSKYDTAVFSGVLEYVYDIDNVFKQLSTSINQVVLSYSCADIVKLSRDKNGWLSDYSKTELEKIFIKYNYKIENHIEWRMQSLYNLIKL